MYTPYNGFEHSNGTCILFIFFVYFPLKHPHTKYSGVYLMYTSAFSAKVHIEWYQRFFRKYWENISKRNVHKCNCLFNVAKITEISPINYTDDLSIFFTVLTSACESNPCVNNGYCSSDLAVDPSQYKCACSAWFTGKNCEGEKTVFFFQFNVYFKRVLLLYLTNFITC